MLIVRTSLLTGITHSMEIPVTSEQLTLWKAGGIDIQNVIPNLTPEEREFIMTGITPEEWATLVDDEEE